ncbi:MAG: cadherin-like domain-containing protein [Dehalococcoidia bacterium]
MHAKPALTKPSMKAVAAVIAAGAMALLLIAPTGAQVNTAPTPQNDAASTVEDNPRTVLVLENDTDPEMNPLRVISVSAPAHGSVVINEDSSIINGDTVTYTPAANFHGTDTFTYVASDGALTASATVTMTVTPVNDAPVAVDDVVTVTEDQAQAFSVVANDSDVDGDALTIVATSEAAHGTVAVGTGGTIAYAPDAGYTGPDSFTYVISDGNGLTSAATVSVTVQAKQPEQPSNEIAARVAAACEEHGDQPRIRALCGLYAGGRLPSFAHQVIGFNILRKVETTSTVPVAQTNNEVLAVCNTAGTSTLLTRLCAVYLDPTTPDWLEHKVGKYILKIAGIGTASLSFERDRDDDDQKDRDRDDARQQVIAERDDDDDDDRKRDKRGRGIGIAIQAAVNAERDRDHDDDDRKRDKQRTERTERTQQSVTIAGNDDRDDDDDDDDRAERRDRDDDRGDGDRKRGEGRGNGRGNGR